MIYIGILVTGLMLIQITLLVTYHQRVKIVYDETIKRNNNDNKKTNEEIEKYNKKTLESIYSAHLAAERLKDRLYIKNDPNCYINKEKENRYREI